ncbi:protein of unknown function [Aminobacter niigataensis]|nr:protein of unknown function [Aminobacter niigataensis]
MAELVDARDLKSLSLGYAGSIPAVRTRQESPDPDARTVATVRSRHQRQAFRDIIATPACFRSVNTTPENCRIFHTEIQLHRVG